MGGILLIYNMFYLSNNMTKYQTHESITIFFLIFADGKYVYIKKNELHLQLRLLGKKYGT